VTASTRRAAVFDLDNTLVRGSTLFHFGVDLVRRRRLPARHVARYALAELSYVARRAEPTGVAADAAGRVLGLVAGSRREEVLDLAERFAAERLDRHLRPDVVSELQRLRAKGYLTVLATASPQELATVVARRLGIDVAIGTVAETVDGRYTGRLDGSVAHGPAKAARVAEVLREHGAERHSSWAFSDSVNDLPLLLLVGNPVAVHADRELSAIACLNGWRTMGPYLHSEEALARLQVLHPFPY
jgi:HAD superfamily hydrolase (TIGR01490 family)